MSLAPDAAASVLLRGKLRVSILTMNAAGFDVNIERLLAAAASAAPACAPSHVWALGVQEAERPLSRSLLSPRPARWHG